MNPERWERLQAVFHAAAAAPDDTRGHLLDELCAGDEALRREVTAMLAADRREDLPLDRPLAEAAGRVMGGPAEAPPATIGPYRLLERLGEGGTGIVYRAEREDLGTQVAIKFLRDAWLSPGRRERFLTEQRTLAALHHPAIAQLFDADRLPDGTPWFAMEFVQGIPVTTFCARGDHSLRRVLGLFRVVCEAVRHAHQQAIIHCDLKPANILVTDEGLVKLLDFGIARTLAGSAPTGDTTEAGLRPLTPAYAAPEQLHGGPLGVHTDLYALGVLLYELLTGRLPHDPAARIATGPAAAGSGSAPEPPSVASRRARGGVPTAGRAAWADLDVLCLRAMHPEPARRYPSVESLIRDLDHFLRGEPLEARPDSAGYRIGKFARRHWRPLLTAGLATAAVVTLVAFYTVRLERARRAAVTESQRTRRIQSFMTGLFDGGDPESGPSDTLRVHTLLERGEQQARAITGEPLVRGELRQTLGEVYERLGDFARADSLLQSAWTERRTRLGSGHPDVVRSLIALASLRTDESRLDEAESFAREAVARAAAQRPPDPALVARAGTVLGGVFEARGDYPAAIAALAEAARVETAAGLDEGERANTLTHLANCHFYAGAYPVSDSLNRVVLALDRTLYGERNPHVAGDLVNLGAIQQEWGRYTAAESLYREALSIYSGWYGRDHYEVAATMTMIGRTRLQAGDEGSAGGMLREALAIRERVYGPRHPSVASTLNELGTLALRTGRLDDAEAAFRRTADIYTATYHGRHYLIGVAYSNLGSVDMGRRRFAEAERLYRRALESYAGTLPADHLYAGIARLKLGRSLLRQGRAREAEPETRAGYDIVRAKADAGVHWLENARQDLAEIDSALGRPGVSRHDGDGAATAKPNAHEAPSRRTGTGT